MPLKNSSCDKIKMARIFGSLHMKRAARPSFRSPLEVPLRRCERVAVFRTFLNEWRFLKRPRAENCRYVHDYPPHIQKCTIYRHAIYLHAFVPSPAAAQKRPHPWNPRRKNGSPTHPLVPAVARALRAGMRRKIHLSQLRAVDMGVDLRCRDIGVPQDFLQDAQVGTARKHMGRK